LINRCIATATKLWQYQTGFVMASLSILLLCTAYFAVWQKGWGILDNFFKQIWLYFEMVPFWPFVLLGFVVMIGLIVDYINRRRRMDTVEYFDSAFQEELAGLYPIASRWPDELSVFMQPRLPILLDAFTTLRNFIPQDQLREYNIAWNEFNDFSRTTSPSVGSDSEISPEVVREQQLLQQQQFQKMVATLLSYTEQFKQ